MGRIVRPVDAAERQRRHRVSDAVAEFRRLDRPSSDDLAALIALAPGFQTTIAAALAVAQWPVWSDQRKASEWLALCWAVEVWRIG